MTSETLDKQIATDITNLIKNGKPSRPSSYCFIEDDILETHINSFIDSNVVVIIGIHRFMILDFPVSTERLKLEFAALCYLNMISVKWMKKNPNLSLQERINSENAVLAIISRKAFSMFECFHLGVIRQTKSVKETTGAISASTASMVTTSSPINDMMLEFMNATSTPVLTGTVTRVTSFAIHSFVVVNKTHGKIQWASKEAIERVLDSTRWTTDIFGAHGIRLKRKKDESVEINCVNYHAGDYFYVQSCFDVDNENERDSSFEHFTLNDNVKRKMFA